MNAEQLATWRRIETTPLIGATEDELFLSKLARQNGWSKEHAARCIAEYRKFVFLAVTAGHPVSPSDAVDQVWHLHLTYTAAYWKIFCAEVLGQPLHHSPSKGGTAESQKFQNWYEHTLQSYRACFEQEPADIWPEASKKIEEDQRQYRRVDTGRYWVLLKPRWVFSAVRAAVVAIPVLLALGCSPWGNTGLRWNVDGPTFLAFYIMLLGAAAFTSVSIRRKFSRGFPLSAPPDLSLYEVAFLAGGARRLIQALIVRLHEAGAVTVDDKGKVQRLGEIQSVHPVETELHAALETGAKNWDDLRHSIQSSLAAMQERLTTLGVLVPSGNALKARAAAGLLMAAAVTVGAVRLWHGFLWERPMGFLAFLVMVALGFFIWTLQRPFRTPAGDALLANLENAHREAKSRDGSELNMVTSSQLALAVGLIGVCALKGTPLEAMESKLGAKSAGSCGTSCGGGCGGSSCGGGGCGGCGGCGG